MTRKIDYAFGATAHFIGKLHRDGFDRGMISLFNENCYVVQNFTSNKAQLARTLVSSSQVRVEGGTRLYDSVQDVVDFFWAQGDRRRPWMLVVITDGEDTDSKQYRRNPGGIGRYVAQRFTHETSNYMTVVGVGNVDRRALATFGNTGNFPAITLNNFGLLEKLFLDVALQMYRIVTKDTRRLDGWTWEMVSQQLKVAQIAFDYAFLIDCSGSMADRA